MTPELERIDDRLSHVRVIYAHTARRLEAAVGGAVAAALGFIAALGAFWLNGFWPNLVGAVILCLSIAAGSWAAFVIPQRRQDLKTAKREVTFVEDDLMWAVRAWMHENNVAEMPPGSRFAGVYTSPEPAFLREKIARESGMQRVWVRPTQRESGLAENARSW